jgi:hypothetical protein
MLRAHRNQQRGLLIGAMFYCALTFGSKPAGAAGRSKASAVRRTASAPATDAEAARAGRSTETGARLLPRGVRAESARTGVRYDANSRAAASAAKHDDDKAKAAPLGADERAPARLDRAATAKGAGDAKLVAKSTLEGKTPPDVKVGADTMRAAAETSARVAENRPATELRAAAKAPIDLPTTQKSTAEKFAGETGNGEAVDPARSGLDLPANARAVASPLGVSASSSTTAGAGRPAVVTLEGPVFDSGEVPRAAASLERLKTAFARCAAAENALTKNEASVDLRFLVRAPGRAEGVGADKARGLSADVVRCMTTVLARSYIGAPSDDPVGVAVTVRVRKD